MGGATGQGELPTHNPKVPNKYQHPKSNPQRHMAFLLDFEFLGNWYLFGSFGLELVGWVDFVSKCPLKPCSGPNGRLDSLIRAVLPI
jgi:hypothetical protein